MYAEHCPKIARAMRSDLRMFKRGALFAVLSIRQQFTLIPDQLDEVTRGDYGPLWGFKLGAFDYIEEHLPRRQGATRSNGNPARGSRLRYREKRFRASANGL